MVKCIVPGEGSSTKAYVKRLKSVVLKLSPLFANYIKAKDQLDFIFSIEDACVANRHAFSAFQTILHALYEDQHEIIGEDAVSACKSSSWHLAQITCVLQTTFPL